MFLPLSEAVGERTFSLKQGRAQECLTLVEANTFLPQMVSAQHTGNASKIIGAFEMGVVEVFSHN